MGPFPSLVSLLTSCSLTARSTLWFLLAQCCEGTTEARLMHRYLSLSGLQLIMVHLAKMLSWSCDKNRRKLWSLLRAKKKVRGLMTGPSHRFFIVK